MNLIRASQTDFVQFTRTTVGAIVQRLMELVACVRRHEEARIQTAIKGVQQVIIHVNYEA